MKSTRSRGRQAPPSQQLSATLSNGGSKIGETVNHPPHYNAHPSGVECIEIVEHMCFNLGNAIKYIWRADEKGNAIEDLEKARWYLDREITRRQREAATS